MPRTVSTPRVDQSGYDEASLATLVRPYEYRARANISWFSTGNAYSAPAWSATSTRVIRSFTSAFQDCGMPFSWPSPELRAESRNATSGPARRAIRGDAHGLA